MYNFELIVSEEVMGIFDDVYISQDKNSKNITIILTNKRVLFLDYVVLNEGCELLRVARGMNYLKKKDVYYQINLDDVYDISKGESYKIILKDGIFFEFDNDELYLLMNELLQRRF